MSRQIFCFRYQFHYIYHGISGDEESNATQTPKPIDLLNQDDEVNPLDGTVLMDLDDDPTFPQDGCGEVPGGNEFQ